MQILLCSATALEMAPTLENPALWRNGNHSLHHLVTGVGMLSSCYTLTEQLLTRPADLVILAGIGGSFRRELNIGASCLVDADRVADLGVEEAGQWKDLFDLNLSGPNEFPYQDGWLKNTGSWKKFLSSPLPLPEVGACTVNEITTSEARIELLRNKYHPTLESMEGAAIHYSCIKRNIPFLHIRSISNYVGERNKNNWNIPLAVRNLNEELQHILSLL